MGEGGLKPLRLLDPSYGLFLHWLWERQRRGSLLSHLLCGIHGCFMICLVEVALVHLIRTSTENNILAFTVGISYGIFFVVRASWKARKCAKNIDKIRSWGERT